MNAPLTPAQVDQIHQALAYAKTTGQLPGLVGPHAGLNVPDRTSQWLGATSIDRLRLDIPNFDVPNSENLSLQITDRVISFTDMTINSPSLEKFGFPSPGIAFCINASVRDDTNTSLAGLDPLNLFRIQFQRSTNYLFQTEPVMGGAICGTASRPGFLPGPGWQFTTGAFLNVSVTPLKADLQIDIMVRTLDIIGPGNVG